MIKHNSIETTKSRKKIEKNKTISNNIFRSSLFILASSALFFSILIILLIIFKGIFNVGNVWDDGNWLFGNKYDGIVYFAAGFMVINTIWTSFLALLFALPISILTALFITRVAPKSMKTFFFIVLSILAAIPSVIYGAFGSRVIDILVINIFNVYSGTLLSIVFTLAFMIMPTITLITTTAINSVDRKVEMSSLALGATKNQTSFCITLKLSASGILVASILGIGRAIGEATAVSMITMDPYTGPTFGLFNQIRLLTSTMLKGYNEMEPGSQQQASMFAMGMLLILTILLVFLTMKYIQKSTSNDSRSLKSSKKIIEISNLKKELNLVGMENLSIKKQKKFIKLERKHNLDKEINNIYYEKYKKEFFTNKTTVVTTNEKSKQLKSKWLGLSTFLVALLGVIFLFSIIFFLIFTGSKGLSWSYITNSGEEGLKSAIFGTVFLIFLSMLMIIPLGVGTGIYFSVFAKDTKISNLLLFGIDILAGIPSLIFGLFGLIVFLPFSNLINFVPLSGAIILALIVTPTVVKTTEEAINSVPKKEIDGSLALGSTKTNSSLKIALPQAMPQILSGLILAVGRIIGESAALIMVFGTVSRNSSLEWISKGGTTLATEMYRLTLLEEIPWDKIAAIGIVILSLIFVLSLLSNYISTKNTLGVFAVLISLILLLIGIFVGGVDGFVVFLIGIFVLILIIFYTILKTAFKFRMSKWKM